MLVIRTAQLDALIKGTEDEFVEFLVGHVKETQPNIEQHYDDEELRRKVRIGLARGRRNEFSNAEDLTAFVSLMFKIAPNFDEQRDIRAVFDDTTIPVEERFERLQSPAFPKKAWREAKKNHDNSAWQPEADKDSDQ